MGSTGMNGLKDIFPKKHPWFHIKLDQESPSGLSHLYNSKTDIYMSIEEASEFLINHAHEMTILPQEITNP
jgi:UPF0288 family protein (methanogenesis marker protein 3)